MNLGIVLLGIFPLNEFSCTFGDS